MLGHRFKDLEFFRRIFSAIFIHCHACFNLVSLVTNYLGNKEKPMSSENKQGVDIQESDDNYTSGSARKR